MARTNPKTADHRVDRETRLAGGRGNLAAKQDAEALLRRVVLANLLWENVAYEDGKSISDQIRDLVPQVEPSTVAAIAREARVEQKLRHVPLLLARECARHDTHKKVVDKLLPQIVRRPDDACEFMSIYWADGKQPIAHSVRRGLAAALGKFDEYQLAKWSQGGREVKLRDVMFLVHPEPVSEAQASLFKRLADDELATPQTWEVALSGGADKRSTWESMIRDGKLGALAFVRNLRNMEEVGVSPAIIRQGFDRLNPQWLLPLNFFAAAKAAPNWTSEIEQTMFGSLAQAPRLGGVTHLIVDVSGSMTYPISPKSTFTRLDAAAAMAVLAREMCDHVTVWTTAGSDYASVHQTERLVPARGFALASYVTAAAGRLGGGGIFVRQCLDYVREQVGDDAGDRTIVFSDSQDTDRNPGVPRPLSAKNYVVDVSAHQHGVNYEGIWDAEVSGWSEHFFNYIAALEAS